MSHSPDVAQAREKLVATIVENLTQVRCDGAYPTIIPHALIDALIAAVRAEPLASSSGRQEEEKDHGAGLAADVNDTGSSTTETASGYNEWAIDIAKRDVREAVGLKRDHFDNAALEVALDKVITAALSLGRVRNPDINLRVICTAYGWDYNTETGEVHGLTAGDHGFEATGIIIETLTPEWLAANPASTEVSSATAASPALKNGYHL